ncbi:RNA-guided endonuclease TnpB family protein [Methylobacter sp. G7]|uniref:RNA-guided endonuclease TnpB family protein n=1 Tax=Methylobacter sp. G7 TaxID=3230117 RepID=UPI003D802EF0
MTMLIQKSYKFCFYPDAAQVEQLAREFGCARFVWNQGLIRREYAYQQWGVSLSSAYDISSQITGLKKLESHAWLKDATAGALQQKLIDQDKAFDNFFKGRASFPKFKKKSHAQSIRYQLDQRCVLNNYRAGELLKLPKLGELKVKWSQVPGGIPKMVTVSKSASGKYFVGFMCEVEQDLKPMTGKVVGIDVGIKSVVVSSDGFHSGAPKYTYYYQRRLRKAQRVLSRKKKGSNGWKKQRIVVARVHEKIANSRKDFLHKLTTKLVSENDVICVEDLNVSGMMRNRCLSKAVADVGIFELNRRIQYKSAWYGKEVIKISRWEPSTKTCSSCGQIRIMKLSQRVYECECGLVIDRDLNAALNIKRAGLVLSGAIYQLDKVAA